MNTQNKEKQWILVADDSEMNRLILTDILGDEFEILEAGNGEEAVMMLQKYGTQISLLLLDIVMPKMDGFEVLAMMNRYKWIEQIPVIMISAESAPSYVERAYDLGVTDYISRPFDTLVVHRRVVNTIMLYAKQRRLAGMVADQIYKREKSNSLMINILSHIVEFRNGESGLHVLHINTMTELLLRRLVQKTDRYGLDYADISLISTASALHDIGKIGIAAEILNKPGRLTKEEFEIMKTHSLIGAQMLEKLPDQQEEPLVKVAYQICRWHHERYDGSGYPDGLKGEEIPISAQVVALADVYDALTSERVYKPAYTHEKAMQMILNGECGVFNPLVLECLQDIEDRVGEELKVNSLSRKNRREVSGLAEEMLQHEELSSTERTINQLEQIRAKEQFFLEMSDEIWFEYSNEPPVLSLSTHGARCMGLPEQILDPAKNEQLRAMFGPKWEERIEELILHGTEPVLQMTCPILVGGQNRWYRMILHTNWSAGETREVIGIVGKLVEVQEEHTDSGSQSDGTEN